MYLPTTNTNVQKLYLNIKVFESEARYMVYVERLIYDNN